MTDFTPPSKFVAREHAIRVLSEYAEVEVLSNSWLRISKPNVIEEQAYLHDTMLVASVTRLAGRLNIPVEYFLDPVAFEQHVKECHAATAPFAKGRFGRSP